MSSVCYLLSPCLSLYQTFILMFLSPPFSFKHGKGFMPMSRVLIPNDYCHKHTLSEFCFAIADNLRVSGVEWSGCAKESCKFMSGNPWDERQSTGGSPWPDAGHPVYLVGIVAVGPSGRSKDVWAQGQQLASDEGQHEASLTPDPIMGGRLQA